MSEDFDHDEPLLVEDTTQAEIDYIATRVAEAQLAMEAGSAGGMEDDDSTTVEERELAQWVESVGEASGINIEAPLVEDVVEESTEEEAKADDPPATGRGCVLWRASSSEPVRPRRTKPWQGAKGESVRQTRAAIAKETAKTMVAKKKATASSSSKRRRTPSPSPPPADVDTEVVFDLGSLSPRRKRKAAEEEVEDE